MIKEIAEHRTVRRFTDRKVEQAVMDEILVAASRASTVGNMQLYSIIVSQDEQALAALAPYHFSQPAITTAPLVLTFCADVRRFSKWCEMRGASPAYDNFCWFMNATTDALLASQNAALEAEAHGLGICYLGTTLYNAGEIAALLELPRGVIPVMAISMGYPESMPPLTDRLPIEGVVHYEKYTDYTAAALENIWAGREESEETKKLLEINELPTLAHVFTERRYTREDSLKFSRKYFDELVSQGFFNQ